MMLNIQKFSRKNFCRVYLREIWGKWLKTALVMRKKRSFSDSDPPLPPPSPRNPPIFALLFTHFKASFQIFKANCTLKVTAKKGKMTTLKEENDHFEGGKWSLRRWNLCRWGAKLRIFIWTTRFPTVQNWYFQGYQIAKQEVKLVF